MKLLTLFSAELFLQITGTKTTGKTISTSCKEKHANAVLSGSRIKDLQTKSQKSGGNNDKNNTTTTKNTTTCKQTRNSAPGSSNQRLATSRNKQEKQYYKLQT